MPKLKPGAKYTPEEAEARVPFVVQGIALEAVDLMIALDKQGVNSQAFESRMFSLTGQVGELNHLCYGIWKFKALEKAATKSTDTPSAPIFKRKT